MLERMDEIIVLEDGRVIEQGTHITLMAARGWYHRMWCLQNDVIDLVM